MKLPSPADCISVVSAVVPIKSHDHEIDEGRKVTEEIKGNKRFHFEVPSSLQYSLNCNISPRVLKSSQMEEVDSVSDLFVGGPSYPEIASTPDAPTHIAPITPVGSNKAGISVNCSTLRATMRVLLFASCRLAHPVIIRARTNTNTNFHIMRLGNQMVETVSLAL
ncbi:hypothetical protein ACR42D_10185 [Desulfovibrio caledoniensis]